VQREATYSFMSAPVLLQFVPVNVQKLVAVPAAAALQPDLVVHPSPVVALKKSPSAVHEDGSSYTPPQLAWPVQQVKLRVGRGGGETASARSLLDSARSTM
jgi:hypothetical protein